MSWVDTVSRLFSETPYLAGGFLVNVLITVSAMTLGTGLGVGIGALRSARPRPVRLSAQAATAACRNIPSFVLMFYLAFMLPPEIVLGASVVAIPAWIKASIALTMPVVGFMSDQVHGGRAEERAAARRRMLAAWIEYALIVFMATSFASVIGADEIVGRANRVVLIVNEPGFLTATYAYVAGWFVSTAVAFRVLTALSGLGRASRKV